MLGCHAVPRTRHCWRHPPSLPGGCARHRTNQLPGQAACDHWATRSTGLQSWWQAEPQQTLRQRCCQRGAAPAHIQQCSELLCPVPAASDRQGPRGSGSLGRGAPTSAAGSSSGGTGHGDEQPLAGLSSPSSSGGGCCGQGLSRAGVSGEPNPVMHPEAPPPLGPNFPMAPSALQIYEGPPSLGIVKHLIENTVKATRQHGLRAEADGHPGASWHWGPSTARLACRGSARPGSRLVGTAWLRVHPSQASVERREAPGKPPTDVLPPTQEGALSQNFG